MPHSRGDGAEGPQELRLEIRSQKFRIWQSELVGVQPR